VIPRAGPSVDPMQALIDLNLGRKATLAQQQIAALQQQ
jgi:hypothetical protein